MIKSVIAFVIVAGSLPAQSRSRLCNPDAARPDTPVGSGIFLEEDNLQAHPPTDRNYTMGLGFQWSGGEVGIKRQDFALNWLDDGAAWLMRGVSGGRKKYISEAPCDFQATSAVLSGTAFTPLDIHTPSIVVGDRPYSFLLGWTVRRTRIRSTRSAWTTEATIGTIGSPIGRWVQTGIHKVFREIKRDSTPFEPRGWPHQILNFPTGIPTARYGVGYERALVQASADTNHRLLEITGSAHGEVGYYTTGSLGAQARLGYFSTPFWLFNADPLGGSNRGGRVSLPRVEGFIWARGAGRAVGYNALLQGYGSWLSDYRVRSSEMKRMIGEYSYGGTVVMRFDHGRSSYAFTWVRDAMRSSELATAFGRSHYWGGLLFTRSR